MTEVSKGQVWIYRYHDGRASVYVVDHPDYTHVPVVHATGVRLGDASPTTGAILITADLLAGRDDLGTWRMIYDARIADVHEA